MSFNIKPNLFKLFNFIAAPPLKISPHPQPSPNLGEGSRAGDRVNECVQRDATSCVSTGHFGRWMCLIWPAIHLVRM